LPRNREKRKDTISMSGSDQPATIAIDLDKLTNVRTLHQPRHWTRWCPDCKRETKHRCTATSDQGAIAHCAKCSRKILLQGMMP